MSKIDERYVDALNNFSKSLETIVEILQQQVSNKDTDILETMSRNMGDNLGQIVADLDEIKQTTTRVESNTNKILNEIRELKKRNQSGGIGEISNPENKEKIIDGIKIITLIAGGVLAIGLAFKLIGHVDPVSVITLGITITIMAVTFSYINDKFKDLTFKRSVVLTGMLLVLSMGIAYSSRILMGTSQLSGKIMISATFTALILSGTLFILTRALDKIKFGLRTILGLVLLPFLGPIISKAIVLSSHILKNASTIPLHTISSVAFTSIALGIALYSITTAVSKMNMKSSVISMLTKGAVFGLIIAAVAGGIVLGSMILSKVTPITLMQGMTSVFTAITLGIVLFTISKTLEFTDGITILKALEIGVLMVISAWSIKKSSEILSGVVPFSFSFSIRLVITTIAIGIALYVFSYAWKKFASNMINIGSSGVGVGGTNNLKTAGAIITVAFTIAAVSWILSAGNYSGAYPNLKWSLSVGLSLVEFGGMVYVISKYMDIMDWKKSLLSVGMVVLLSGAILATSWILSFGKYDKFPSFDWVKNVGISMVTFGSIVLAFGLLMEGSGGIGYAALALGLVAILGIAVTITATSYILGLGNYDTYPSMSWVTSIGLVIGTFGLIGPLALIASVFSIPILIISSVISKVSEILNKGDYSKGPSLGWATGTSLLLTAFSLSAISLGVVAMTGIGFLAILAGVKLMKYVAESIVEVSKTLSQGTYTGGPTFEWANGIGTSITAFATAIATMGMSTGGLKSLLFGIDVKEMKQSISAVVDGMVEANLKLSDSKLNWSSNYPSKEWSEGVGTAVSKFAEASRSLTGGWFSKDITSSFVGLVDILIQGIIKAAEKMNTSTISWGNLSYPSTDWITNISSAIKSFLDLSRSLRGGWFDKNLTTSFVDLVDVLLTGLIHAGTMFSTGSGGKISWNTLPYPTSDWVKNIDSAINSFILLSNKSFSTDNILNLNQMFDTLISIANRFNGRDLFNNDVSLSINRFSNDLKLLVSNIPTKESVDRLTILSDSITKISGIGLSTSASIYLLSKSLSNLGDTMDDLDISVFDKLRNFSSSFTAISLIDNLKLQQTIDIIKSKRLDIKAVIDDNSSRFSSISTPMTYFPGTATINSPFMNTGVLSEPLTDLVESNKNIDKNIQEMLKLQKETAGSIGDTHPVSTGTRFGNH